MSIAQTLATILAATVAALVALASLLRWAYKQGEAAGAEKARREAGERLQAETRPGPTLLSGSWQNTAELSRDTAEAQARHAPARMMAWRWLSVVVPQERTGSSESRNGTQYIRQHPAQPHPRGDT